MCFTEGMMSTTLLWCWLQWRWLHHDIENMSLPRQLLIVLKLFQEQPGMQDLAKFCGRASLWGTVYALQFLQWWYQREHLLQPLRPHKAPPPPPQRFPYPESLPTTSARGAPKVVVLPEDRTICPLCHRPRQNPAMSCGGYAFCYTCLVPHVQEFGHCPVTGQRMRVEEIRRIRDEGWRGKKSSCSATKTKLTEVEVDIFMCSFNFWRPWRWTCRSRFCRAGKKTEMSAKADVSSSKGCECWEHGSLEWEKECLSASRGWLMRRKDSPWTQIYVQHDTTRWLGTGTASYCNTLQRFYTIFMFHRCKQWCFTGVNSAWFLAHEHCTSLCVAVSDLLQSINGTRAGLNMFELDPKLGHGKQLYHMSMQFLCTLRMHLFMD